MSHDSHQCPSVTRIFIAPLRGQPMVAVAAVEALTECGLAGDRYADAQHRRSPDYQVTVDLRRRISPATHGGNRHLCWLIASSQSAGAAIGAVVSDSAAQPLRRAPRTTRAGMQIIHRVIATHRLRQGASNAAKPPPAPSSLSSASVRHQEF